MSTTPAPKPFYYQLDGTIIGPVTGIDLRDAALAGNVAPNTLIANDPSGEWIAAIRIRGLFDERGKPLPHPVETRQFLEGTNEPPRVTPCRSPNASPVDHAERTTPTKPSSTPATTGHVDRGDQQDSVPQFKKRMAMVFTRVRQRDVPTWLVPTGMVLTLALIIWWLGVLRIIRGTLWLLLFACVGAGVVLLISERTNRWLRSLEMSEKRRLRNLSLGFGVVISVVLFLLPNSQVSPERATHFYQLAYQHAEAGEFEAAVHDYGEAIRHKPDSVNAHVGRAMAHEKLGNMERAIEDATKVIRLDPNNVDGYLTRGNALAETRIYERSNRDYEEVIRLDTDAVATAMAHNNLGLNYIETGDYDAAITELEIAVKLGDPLAEANLKLAYKKQLAPSEIVEKNSPDIAQFQKLILDVLGSGEVIRRPSIEDAVVMLQEAGHRGTSPPNTITDAINRALIVERGSAIHVVTLTLTRLPIPQQPGYSRDQRVADLRVLLGLGEGQMKHLEGMLNRGQGREFVCLTAMSFAISTLYSRPMNNEDIQLCDGLARHNGISVQQVRDAYAASRPRSSELLKALSRAE